MTSGADGARASRFHRFEPLPERAERNRRRLWVYLALYIALSSLLAACALVGGVYLTTALIALRTGDPLLLHWLGAFTSRLPMIACTTWLVCLPVFSIWCLRALSRPASTLLGGLRAIPVPTGEHPKAKSALHDAVIAAGVTMPRLAMICDDSVNAFVLAHDRDVAWVGVTSGLVDTLSQAELRCVFAHLISRVRDGSAQTASVLAALFDAATTAGRVGDAVLDGYVPDEDDSVGIRLSKSLVSPAALLYGMIRMCLGLASIVILPGYRRTQAVVAESADSEGMLLMRDPTNMLGALEKVLPADNRPGDVWEPWHHENVFGALFFAWPTISASDDPELVRIERLREVLGAAGA